MAPLWGPCSTPPSAGVSPATVTATLVSGETVRVRVRLGTDTRDASDSRQRLCFFFFPLFFNGAAGTRSQAAGPNRACDLSPLPSLSQPVLFSTEMAGAKRPPTQDTSAKPILCV